MIPGTALTIIIGGLAAAFALAFGLGGRDWAARKLEQMDDSIAGGTPPTTTTKARTPGSRRRPAAPKDDDPLPPGA